MNGQSNSKRMDNPWKNAEAKLKRALRAAGRNPAEAATITARMQAAAQRRPADALPIYDEVMGLYAGLVAGGRKEFEDDLLALFEEKARTQMDAGDAAGASQEYDRAIELLEKRADGNSRGQPTEALARVCFDKALALHALDDPRGAAALYDRAIAIRQELVNQQGRRSLLSELANAYTGKGVMVLNMGDKAGALALYDQAIAILDPLVFKKHRHDLAEDWSGVCRNKADVLSDLGDSKGAVEIYDRVIELWERRVSDEILGAHPDLLANLYFRKADVIGPLGDNLGAAVLLDRVIIILERLVLKEGRRDLLRDLAQAYRIRAIQSNLLGDRLGAVAFLDQAIALSQNHPELAKVLAIACLDKAEMALALDKDEEAAALCDRAIPILDRLVQEEGSPELATYLATTYSRKIQALEALGDKLGVRTLYDKVIGLRELLSERYGRIELAEAYENKADAISAEGDHPGALTLYDQAVPIWERLVKEEGSYDLIPVLSRSKAIRGQIRIALGRKAEGLEDLRSVRDLLVAEMSRTGRDGFETHLAWVDQKIAKHTARE
jgi:tetratricopeptide (TPR) repeat protein